MLGVSCPTNLVSHSANFWILASHLGLSRPMLGHLDALVGQSWARQIVIFAGSECYGSRAPRIWCVRLPNFGMFDSHLRLSGRALGHKERKLDKLEL